MGWGEPNKVEGPDVRVSPARLAEIAGRTHRLQRCLREALHSLPPDDADELARVHLHTGDLEAES